MDPFLLLLQRQSEDDQEEDLLNTIASISAIVSGILDHENEHIRRRNPTRLYLTRSQLMPDPRIESPWVRLWEGQNNQGPGHFADLWDNTPIPRDDVSSRGAPRIGGRSLDAAGALGLVLHYLGSAVLEIQLQLIFAIVPSVLSRYLDFSLDILLVTLRGMEEAKISLPSSLEEYQNLSSLITKRHSLLEGAFASIDGLSLPAQVSNDPEIENATYNGWKTDHRITNVLMFSPKGTIIDAVINAPGSWHDAHTARPIFERLESYVPDGFYVVADTAFPRGPASIKGKIKAPLKAGQRVPADPIEQASLMQMNRQLLSYRQTAEWGMRTMQGSFGRLRVPLDINSNMGRRRLLEICCRLFNVRCIRVGINQIKDVYEPIWLDSEDQRLWTSLGDMMFGEIRKRDRVSRFHVIPV